MTTEQAEKAEKVVHYRPAEQSRTPCGLDTDQMDWLAATKDIKEVTCKSCNDSFNKMEATRAANR